MKVISILMALVNSLTGGLLILSCVSASESLGWITLKIGAGIMAIYNAHGHKLRFPPSKKAQFVTALGIFWNPDIQG